MDGARGVRDGRGGAVVIVQRFGSALNLNVHLHAMVMDDVFTRDARGDVRFHAAQYPITPDVTPLLVTLATRIGRLALVGIVTGIGAAYGLSRLMASLLFGVTATDPTRRSILARLASGDADVSELMKPFDLSQPTISTHLKVLERAGLVARSRDAQRRPRTLVTAPLEGVDRWLESYRRSWEAQFAGLDTRRWRSSAA